MARTIKIFLLVFFGTYQMFNALSVPQDVEENLNVNGSTANFSTNAFNETEEETTTEDVCGTIPLDSSDGGRRRRSEQYSFNDSVANDTYEMIPEEDYSYLSDQFMNCLHFELEPECYEKRPDNTVFVPVYQTVFPVSDYLIRESLLFICPDYLKKNDRFPSYIGIISTVGSVISVVCLALHIILYTVIAIIKQTNDLPGICLFSLCVALLAAYSLTFLQMAVHDYEGCRVVGMLMAYFFLAAFFWMNVFSYDVWRSIRLATTKLRLTADRPMMVRFARYSVYAWGSPLLISVLSVIIHNSTSNQKFQLVFDINICWFAEKGAQALYFVGPLFTILGINILLTVSSFGMISNAAMQSGSVKGSFDLRARLCLSLRLGSSMGLTWIFGVLAVATMREWLWCLFAICSALQGVFIFLSFTLSERNRKKCVKAFQSRKGSSNPTQLSSNPTTSV